MIIITFISFCECLYQIIKSEGSFGDTPNLQLVSEVRAILWKLFSQTLPFN